MLEKIKALGESAKGVLLYLVLPLVGIFVYISGLLRRNESLKDQLDSVKRQQELSGVQNEKKVIDEQAAKALADYVSANSDYLGKGGGGSSPPPDTL